MHYAKGGVADCRSDHFVDEQGRLLMAWAYQIAGRKDGCDEILILGFALKDDPKTGAKAEKSRPDVTHEMSAYLVDPETPIDFGTSLFEQHRVSPLTPALATVQWQAESDTQALLMAGNRVAALMGGSFDPTSSERWRAGFQADLRAMPDALWPFKPAQPKVPQSASLGAFALGGPTRRRLRLMAILAFGFGPSVWASEIGTHYVSPIQMPEVTSSDWMPYTTFEYGEAIRPYSGHWVERHDRG